MNDHESWYTCWKWCKNVIGQGWKGFGSELVMHMPSMQQHIGQFKKLIFLTNDPFICLVVVIVYENGVRRLDTGFLSSWTWLISIFACLTPYMAVSRGLFWPTQWTLCRHFTSMNFLDKQINHIHRRRQIGTFIICHVRSSLMILTVVCFLWYLRRLSHIAGCRIRLALYYLPWHQRYRQKWDSSEANIYTLFTLYLGLLKRQAERDRDSLSWARGKANSM